VDARLLSVVAPANVPLAVQPYFAEEIQDQTQKLEGGTVERQWSVTNQRGVRTEAQLPPGWAFLPTLCLSAGNWKGVEVQAKLKEAASSQKEAQQRRRSYGGRGERQARLTAIRDFVAKRIRFRRAGAE